MIDYKYAYEAQPTNVSCTQTATAMLLSHYDQKYTAKSVLDSSPTHPYGSSVQELATYCLDQGFDVELFSFDARVLDLSWENLSKDEIIEKLEKVQDVRSISSLGKEITTQYIKDYIDFIKKGGALRIQTHPTQSMLRKLLSDGPFVAAVSYATMKGSGHAHEIGLRESVQDDLSNDVSTHAVLVYGVDDDNNFMIADPWGDPETRTMTSDHLIASIMAAQWLCDNLLFRIAT